MRSLTITIFLSFYTLQVAPRAVEISDELPIQAISASGRLFCGDKPLIGIPVKLIDKDHGEGIEVILLYWFDVGNFENRFSKLNLPNFRELLEAQNDWYHFLAWKLFWSNFDPNFFLWYSAWTGTDQKLGADKILQKKRFLISY